MAAGRHEGRYAAYDTNSAEPMTGSQASHLKTLADEAHEPGAFQQGLSQREASRRINVLAEKVRIGTLPPHTD